MSNKIKYPTVSIPNASGKLRLIPDLAVEIGEKVSIIVLQIEWLCNAARLDNRGDNFKDGHWWTYQSYRDWQAKYFKCWSFNTVRRVIDEAIKDGYIIRSNYNKLDWDETGWFRPNWNKLATLKSIQVVDYIASEPINEDDEATTHAHFGHGSNELPMPILGTTHAQNDTTIPETPTTDSLDDDYHAKVDNLGTLSSDVLPKQSSDDILSLPPIEPSPFQEKEEPVYSAIDEDGNDLRDLSAEALLSRIWRVTKSFKFKATPDKKYYGQVQDLQRKMLKDKRWAEYTNHQIAWCFNEGTPHLGAKRWFEETLDLSGFQSWLNRVENGENPADEIDTSEMKGMPHPYRRRPAPAPYVPKPPPQDPEYVAHQQELIDKGLF